MTYQNLHIKVWNATAGVDEARSKAAANWLPINSECDHYYIARMVDSAEYVITGYGYSVIPLIRGQENILNYQIVSANGKSSGVRTLLINVSDELTELEIGLSPEPGDVSLTSALAFVKKLTGDAKIYCYDGVSHTPVKETFNITRNGDYWFYAVNTYGNYAFVKKTVTFIDNTKPELVKVNNNNGFSLEYRVKDENIKNMNLYIKYDDAYNKRLGIDDFVKIDLPDYSKGGTVTWSAAEVSKTGVYKVTAEDISASTGSPTLSIILEGAFLYDPEGGDTVRHPIYILVADEVGNSSDLLTDTAEGVNEKPAVKNITYSTFLDFETSYPVGNVIAEFNTPVILETPTIPSLLLSPEDYKETLLYSTKKQKLPFYDNVNDCIFQFTDLFGNRYTEAVEIDCIDDYILDVSYSTTEPTKDDVIVTIRSVCPGRMFDVYADGMFPDFNKTEVSVTMSSNGIIKCFFKDGKDERLVKIPVDNIFKTAPQPTVKWYYTEFASNTLPLGAIETTGEVKVWFECDKKIRAINGKSDFHTFTYGGEPSYTFEFSDLAGNTGTLTVTLPIPIVAPTGVSDTLAPTYIMDIYGRYGNAMSLMSSWSTLPGTTNDYATLADTIDALSWVGGYLIKFNVFDSSLTRLIILNGADADTAGLTFSSKGEIVQGVSVSGMEIAVSANTTFTVAIIDKADNVTSLSFTASWIDTEYPVIEVTYEKIDFNKTRAYIKLSDNTNQVNLVSPAGLPRMNDPASGYIGQYYIDFSENGSIQCIARDVGNNVVTKTIEVTGLDTANPTATVEWWSPCLVLDGVPNPIYAPITATNKNVRVCLSFNKTVISAKAYVWVGGSFVEDKDGTYVTVDLNVDKAIVTYLQNTDMVKLEYTAYNGKSGEIYLDSISVIDKEAPVIRVDQTNDIDTKKNVTVTFTVENEPVYANGCGVTGRLYNVGDEITKTIAVRGTTDYSFVDAAGNVTVKTVTVANIDEEPPVIIVSGENPGGGYVKGAHTFHATMNEEGTITFMDKTYRVSAPIDRNNDGKFAIDDIGDLGSECDWVGLTVSANGSYQITGIDKAGRTTFTYVTVTCIDNIAPVITFSSPTTLTVRQETSLKDFNKMVLDGVNVIDNISRKDKLTVTYTTLEQTELDTTGLYTITYTATDEAGNTRITPRNVRVFSKDALTVTLNDVKTEEGDTSVFSDVSSFILDIENLPGGKGEPVKVYIRSGRYTAGQMKTGATLIDQNFTITRTGYYTLYIVPQSRQPYLTYFYVQ